MNKQQSVGTPTTREPVGGEIADQTSLPPWSEIAPCDDTPAPAGRQKQQLFAKGNFSD